jgi:hypothetical protein
MSHSISIAIKVHFVAATLLVVGATLGCGGGASTAPSGTSPIGGGGGAGGGVATSDPPRPPPLSAPDKHEAWKGKDATVYEIPSLHVLEVIASSEAAGVDAEYQWLRTQHCGPDGAGTWTTHEQSLQDQDGRQYDVLHCVCSTTSEPHDFRFDITQYFGIDLR